jgi:hypothetical protein
VWGRREPRTAWRGGTGALLVLVMAACGGTSGEEGEPGSTIVEMDVVDPELADAEMAAARLLCDEYVAREVPDGEVLLVVPQSVAEVRFTDPEAWPGKAATDRVVSCAFSLPSTSSWTGCPDGSVVEGAGLGATGSVTLDLDGVVGSESEIVPLDLCEP